MVMKSSDAKYILLGLAFWVFACALFGFAVWWDNEMPVPNDEFLFLHAKYRKIGLTKAEFKRYLLLGSYFVDKRHRFGRQVRVRIDLDELIRGIRDGRQGGGVPQRRGFSGFGSDTD